MERLSINGVLWDFGDESWCERVERFRILTVYEAVAFEGTGKNGVSTVRLVGGQAENNPSYCRKTGDQYQPASQPAVARPLAGASKRSPSVH